MKIDIDVMRKCVEEPVFADTSYTVPESICSAVTADGRRFPAQAAPDGVIVILSAEAGEELTLELSEEKCNTGVVTETRAKNDGLDIKICDGIFTSYICSRDFVKPYLGPILGKNGVGYTRLDLTAKEHPHQRSLIVAVGDVNGVDFWNEPSGEGEEIHNGFENVISGSAYGGFTACNLWQKKDGTPLCDEKRSFTFYNQSEGCRYADIEIVFTATYGEVVFGKTKEAGPLGIRMNEKINVNSGGKMKNSYGGEGESDCWGRAAHWCDYSGIIDGNEYGIAVFDSERNLRYPTTWHIRNYGLFAANNLFFRGELIIPKGETLTYRYRVCFHGEGFEGAVADRFVMYANSEKENTK